MRPDSDSEKDRAVEEVVDLLANFREQAPVPTEEFEAFLRAARQYIGMTGNDPMVHKSVARSVNGLREFLELERKATRKRPVRGGPAGNAVLRRLRSQL